MKNITVFMFIGIASTTAAGQPLHSIEINVYGIPSTASELNATGYFIDGEPVEYNTCGTSPMIAIAIIDSTSCQPLSNCNRNFGQFNIYDDPDGDCITDVNTSYVCRTRAEHYFLFKSFDSTQVQGMIALLDSVEPGHWIIAYSIYSSEFSSMTPDFAATFQQLGSTLIPTLADNLPFIFFCKKGDLNSVEESVGAYSNSQIALSTTFSCSPSGIWDAQPESAFHIHPNPASGDVHLDVGGLSTITISDVLGREVFHSETNGVCHFSSGNLAGGIYYVIVSGRQKTQSQKLVIFK